LGLSKETGPVLVQKTAFCDAHTPADADSRPRVATANKHQQLLTNSGHNPLETDLTREDLRQKMKKARRILAKKRSTLPIISIPTIPPERIQEIASLVNIPKKSQFIQRLIAYWTLKRQFRNGVPLLRRLQSSHLSRRDESQPQQEVGDLYRQLKYWQCLRQDLERARLLCELVRKREKLKNEMLKILWPGEVEEWLAQYETSDLIDDYDIVVPRGENHSIEQRALELKIAPFTTFLRHLWKLIEAKDIGDIFLEPVDQNEVLDYADVVKHPMDLSTMRIKLENNKYIKLAEFEDDFNLMINNCLTYNSKDTVFYKSAIRMRDQCSELFRQARSDFATTNFNVDTGVLLPLNSTFYSENESLKKDTATSSFTIHSQQFDKLPLSDSHIINDINKKFLNILKAGRGK
ncbi:unnamed protein product, partial [Timema podura]|nr:unnamed protein product [Timema podura]